MRADAVRAVPPRSWVRGAALGLSRAVALAAAAVAALAVAGCTGAIGDAGADLGEPGETSSTGPGAGRGGSSGGAAVPGAPAPPSPSACALQVPETGLRRLNRVEYDNTLRDLGLAAADARLAVDGFTGDAVIGGAKRGFTIGGPVESALARDLVDTALGLAAKATQDLPKLLGGCAPRNAAEEDACVRSFVSSFGRRALRRPLVKTEVDELVQLFVSTRGAFDFRAGVEAALAALLAAPEFIYLVERGPDGSAPGKVVAVEPVALASRLSYFLWDSTPDPQLLMAAESGALATDRGLEAEVRRMLADPRARGAVNQFVREWSFVDDLERASKDRTKFPWYTPELAAALEASFVATLEGVFWGAQPTLESFLGSKTMLANAAMAKAYGMASPTGTGLVEATVDPAQRRGPLTHPAFLALAAKPSRGDPIRRGLFVRQQILCTHLPEPPDTDPNGNPIPFDVAPPAPGVSNRDRFRQHTESPFCSGCHNLIDPIGFGFESYDATGRFRTIDEERNPVDARGEVQGGGDVTGPFDGAVQLIGRVVKSETVAECATLQWFRFALGREETAADGCSNAKVVKRFLASGGNLKEMIVALATSDAFRFRKVLAGEGGAR